MGLEEEHCNTPSELRRNRTRIISDLGIIMKSSLFHMGHDCEWIDNERRRIENDMNHHAVMQELEAKEKDCCYDKCTETNLLDFIHVSM